MSRHHSTLELVRHDETARAPERDYDATAFELDAGALAPQAVFDTTPEVFYNTSFPEAHGNEESTKEHAPSLHITKPALKWPWMVIALVVAAAIAIGVGVGIWRHDEHPSHTLPPVPQNPNITRAAQYILNDTSLAASSLPNGDRQFFFQDNTGLIRSMVRAASNGQWSTSANLNMSSNSNPKNYTPLALTVIPNDIPDNTQMTLYYVSESHVLNSSIYHQGSWTADDTLKNYTTAVDTRSLSVTSIYNGSASYQNATNSALLYYENQTGKASALLQRRVYQPIQNVETISLQWIDITSQESQSLPGEFRNVPEGESHTLYESDAYAVATFSTPFTSRANFCEDSGPGVSSIGALFYSPPNTSLVSTIYDIGTIGLGNFSLDSSFYSYTTEFTSHKTNSSIQQSDIAILGFDYAMWIDGTQPRLISGGYQRGLLPDIVFPFARLASIILPDQSATFVYHQINGTTFAEEQWDASQHAWLPSVYITVSDS